MDFLTKFILYFFTGVIAIFLIALPCFLWVYYPIFAKFIEYLAIAIVMMFLITLFGRAVVKSFINLPKKNN